MGATAKPKQKQALSGMPDLVQNISGSSANLGGLYWNNQWQNINATSPYLTNVVWQDTTSNATYCSASAALAR